MVLRVRVDAFQLNDNLTDAPPTFNKKSLYEFVSQSELFQVSGKRRSQGPQFAETLCGGEIFMSVRPSSGANRGYSFPLKVPVKV